MAMPSSEELPARRYYSASADLYAKYPVRMLPDVAYDEEYESLNLQASEH